MPSQYPAIFGVVGLIGVAPFAMAQSAPPLGEAASFAVLAASAITSSGATTITGNAGVSPGTTISGSPTINVGSIRNDLARQAQSDALAAFNALDATPCGPLPAGPVPHGVYCVWQLTGTLTLDAQGNDGAVWIFRAAASLSTAPGTLVRVVGGGRERNVFWQVGQSATLGAGTTFVGNILARGGIAMGAGATLSGRALALGPSGAVTLDNNKVSLCCEAIDLQPAALPNGFAGRQYSATVIASGGIAPYSYLFSGSIEGLTPSGATLSGTPKRAGTYPLTVTATDALGCSVSRDFNIEIACSTIVVLPSAPPLDVDVPYDLPGAIVGFQYQQTFTTACASSASCAVTSGTLPPGLELTNCVLAGTPTKAGLYQFTITASDASHTPGHQVYRLLVVACDIDLSTVLPAACLNEP